MKSVSVGLGEHIAQEVTMLATCWKITRRDGVVMGFTDHDEDLTVSGVAYLATSGFTPTAVETSAALNVDNLDIEGLLSADAITEVDLLAGRYDHAEVEVFVVNYVDLTQGVMMLRTGWLGEVTVKGGQFVAELRGLTQKLATRVGQTYSPACRAQFVDASCGVALATHTETGNVSGVTSRQIFEDSERSEDAGYFAYGKITFSSGANDGISMEVKEFANGRFVLALPMPHEVDEGDAYSVVAGCDKTLNTCAGRFGNAVNFRGEPHVPGTDRLLETAGTRSEW